MSRPKSLSFDGLVELYDETRCFDAQSFEAALEYIVDRFPVHAFPSVIEPGIGIRRIALPLAARGYRVTGVDISRDMLDVLRRRIRQNSPKPQVAFLQADIAQLPLPGNQFDMAVVAHVFYFMRRWKKAAKEILRVIRKGRPVLLMHTGTGMEIPFLNDRYAELCAATGNPIPALGVKSTKEVTEYYRSLGCAVEWVHDRWRWTAKIPLDKAIEYMRRRAYSFTAFPPEEIHQKAVRTLTVEAHAKYGDLNRDIEIPTQIYFAIVCRM